MEKKKMQARQQLMKLNDVKISLLEHFEVEYRYKD